MEARTTENREKGQDKEGEQGLARIEKREGIRRGARTTENREMGQDKEGEQGLPRIEKRDRRRREQ